MPYKTDTRDRIEAWPAKGTKALLMKLARAKRKSLAEYTKELLEKHVKRVNNEDGD